MSKNLKFIVIGDSNVGKSNILLQYTNNKFSHHHDITIGVEFQSKEVLYNDTHYKIHIWDTAGQEVFKSLTSSYYKGSIGCLLVYDITNRDSFKNIDMWYNEIKKHINIDDELFIILVGNKNDIKELDEIQVSKEEAEEYAKENKMYFIETSAKENNNIHEAFNYIIKKVDESDKNNKDNKENKNTDKNIDINDTLNSNKRKQYCYYF